MFAFTCVKMADSIILTLKGKSVFSGAKRVFSFNPPPLSLHPKEGLHGLKYHSNSVFTAIYIRYCVASAQ